MLRIIDIEIFEYPKIFSEYKENWTVDDYCWGKELGQISWATKLEL